MDDLAFGHRADGLELWDAFAAEHAGDEVRLVAPTYESSRTSLAVDARLTLAESWWLVELTSGGGDAGVAVDLPGCGAVTVAAPPIYAPPGPMLFLPSVTDADALPAALERARGLGCGGVVVNQRADDQSLVDALDAVGFRRHCDFFEGVVQ